jgi:hypothetical protein
MARFTDLTDQRFGRLVVIAKDLTSTRPHVSSWWCRCDCGVIKSIARNHLVRQHKQTKSCGCSRGEYVRQNKTTHGKYYTPEYGVWLGMKNRCQNNDGGRTWQDYGGRGITVCERWQTFINFLEDMGPRPSKDHTLERKDNSLGYFPGNVIWLPKSQQGQNTRLNHNITVDGVTKCIAQWAREKGIHPSTISKRLYQMGWDEISAVLTPVGTHTRYHPFS